MTKCCKCILQMINLRTYKKTLIQKNQLDNLEPALYTLDGVEPDKGGYIAIVFCIDCFTQLVSFQEKKTH